jgi:hypothetical protein
LAAIAAPGTAHAGRTFYGWLYGTEVMPERGAELQTWISEENHGAAEANAKQTSWLLTPLIGVTDQLEVGLPVDIAWSRANMVAGKTALDAWGIEARYRFVTQDPVDAPALVPLVRIGLKRLVLERDTWGPEADIVTSYQTGIVHALVDLGMYGTINTTDQHFEARPGAGVSIEVVGDLRLGAEVFAALALDDSQKSWVIVGPNLAWSHGRTWVSASYGIGVYQIKDAPRLQWGIAF